MPSRFRSSCLLYASSARMTPRESFPMNVRHITLPTRGIRDQQAGTGFNFVCRHKKHRRFTSLNLQKIRSAVVTRMPKDYMPQGLQAAGGTGPPTPWVSPPRCKRRRTSPYYIAPRDSLQGNFLRLQFRCGGRQATNTAIKPGGKARYRINRQDAADFQRRRQNLPPPPPSPRHRIIPI